MATSLSLSNFLSFLLPSKPPPKPTPPLSFSSVPAQSLSRKTNHVAQEDHSASLSPELTAVINPAFANANTLFFSSTYNVEMLVEEDEPEEKLLGRFRREVMRAGVIQECKRRQFFENKQDERKRKSREAAKRNRRRRPFSRNAPASREETTTTRKMDEADADADADDDDDYDDDDNWEMPEGL